MEKFLLSIFSILLPCNSCLAVTVEGHLFFNGEYKQQMITSVDSNKKEEDITPDLTLGLLIADIGGIKPDSDYKNIGVIRNDVCIYFDLTQPRAQKYLLDNNDKIIVSKLDSTINDERLFEEMVQNNLLQKYLCIVTAKEKRAEIIEYRENQIESLKNFKTKSIIIKRYENGKLKKYKYKSDDEKLNILPKDVVYLQ